MITEVRKSDTNPKLMIIKYTAETMSDMAANINLANLLKPMSLVTVPPPGEPSITIEVLCDFS